MSCVWAGIIAGLRAVGHNFESPEKLLAFIKEHNCATPNVFWAVGTNQPVLLSQKDLCDNTIAVASIPTALQIKYFIHHINGN